MDSYSYGFSSQKDLLRYLRDVIDTLGTLQDDAVAPENSSFYSSISFAEHALKMASLHVNDVDVSYYKL